MISKVRIPAPPLAEFVASLWYYCDYRPLTAIEKMLPTVSTGMVINLAKDRFTVEDQSYRGAILAGVFTKPFQLATAQQSHTIGVALQPGGAFPFLGLPASETWNQHIALEDLWAPKRATFANACSPPVRPRVGSTFWKTSCWTSYISRPGVTPQSLMR